MSCPITPERAAKRALITGYLVTQGPAPTRPIFQAIPEIGDSTECSRLIHEMRKAGEIQSIEIEASAEQRTRWGLPASHPRVVKVHQLVNGHECEDSPDMPEPDPVTAAEFAALAQEPLTDEAPGPELLMWYSSEGDLRIGFAGEVPLALSPADVEALAAFMRRVGLVK